MPIYEFYSPDTHRIYSFFARSLAQGRATPRCPDRDGARMERLVSRFAVTGRSKEAPDPSTGADPRMERAMAEMGHELSSMSDENPDPRQIGRLMRKMSEAAGKKMPEVMEQMIQRLEKGEDPESLEAEYGDALENMGDVFADDSENPDISRAKARPKAPTRDPKLYEMADYV